MNTYTTKAIADSSTFQKYERKRPSKRLLDTSPDEHSNKGHNKGNCVKRGWRMERMNKRTNWEEM